MGGNEKRFSQSEFKNFRRSAVILDLRNPLTQKFTRVIDSI